jgi:hypothetical protein
MQRYLPILACLFLWISCIVSPLPIPPKVRVEAIYLSEDLEEGERLVVALPGAVEVVDGLETRIRNVEQGITRLVVVDAAGAFLAQIPWHRGESLEIRAQAPGSSSGWHSLLVPSEDGPPPTISVDEVTDLGSGEISISGTAWSEAMVIGVNRIRDEAASTLADSAGLFTLILGGAAGEEFVVFGIEPSTRRPSAPHVRLVPEPPATCVEEGGTCVEGTTDCLPHGEPADFFCESETATCCMPRPVSECQAEGGLCLNSPIDPGFPADCEADYGMVTADFECFVINASCCMLSTG